MGQRMVISAALIAVLLFAAYLRLAPYIDGPFAGFAGLATPTYVAASILAFFAYRRTGLDFDRLGFGVRFKLWHLGAALLGVAALQLWTLHGYPALADLMGNPESPGAERFSGVEGSASDLISLLVMSWTVAAIGEEITFRIILMRGLLMTFGGGAIAALLALVISAAVFGLIHLWKGPVGMFSSFVSGLIFGSLVLAARGAIWPAFLAHGFNNALGIWRMYDAS